MENGESKNKFWKGVLVGALVMAFVGLIVVGISAGMFLIGRSVIGNQALVQGERQTDALEPGAAGGGTADDAAGSEEKELNLEEVERKMEYIQSMVDEYFLYDEDPEKVEDGI